MARIRTIKPSFFCSDDVAALPLRARLTWIGLWTQCDDAGRTKDHPRLIKAAIWPLDNVSLADIEEDLSILYSQGRIVRYEVDQQRFLEITNWGDHQKIDRPSKSRIPAPGSGTLTDSANGARPFHEDSTSPRAGKGRERKGREGARAREDPPTDPDSEPPTKCDKHVKTAKPPACGACADARKNHTRWESERSKRLANAPKCRVHRGQPADNCAICRSEELSPA